MIPTLIVGNSGHDPPSGLDYATEWEVSISRNLVLVLVVSSS